MTRQTMIWLRRRRTVRALPGMVAVWVAASASAWAANSTASAVVEGDWVRTDSNGSGDFSDLGAGYRQAELTAWAAAQVASAQQTQAWVLKPLEGAPHQAGQAYRVVQRPCRAQTDPASQGDLSLNPDSMAIHIVVSRDEVMLSPERDGVRPIYTDGRPHPSLIAPMAAGNSIGHFDGPDLIVDTVGMSTGPVPAGGWRTPQTHLTERYIVSGDGRHMSIRYTWSDPKIYVRPHSYTYTFDRLPPGSYAFEYWCDPRDSSQYTSIVPPAQH